MSARSTALHGLLGAALVVVAALTLAPEGAGWSWGSPTEELRWYVTGLDSTATVRQLLGNLGLLVVPAALAVLRWPALGRPDRLVLTAVAAGASIELLQLLLPLGRVVSPLDAALNAAGAVAAGLLVAAGTAGRLTASPGVPG
ncbi:VanZ family protein [Blastococcus sp. SYSU DS0619]